MVAFFSVNLLLDQAASESEIFLSNSRFRALGLRFVFLGCKWELDITVFCYRNEPLSSSHLFKIYQAKAR